MRKGEQTRTLILNEAVAFASQVGLEGLSIGSLAERLDMSKSGLFAHFGSKEELQLATVEEAARVFAQEVLKPGVSVPRGVGRLWAMCNAHLSYQERKVFAGGCFFEAASVEFDSRPGPVRDSVVEKVRYWSESLARAAREAQAVGEVKPDVDPEQLAWELGSMLSAANRGHVIDGGVQAFDRARRAIRDRLQRVATSSAAPLGA